VAAFLVLILSHPNSAKTINNSNKCFITFPC
jgi:hypothetical protein